MKNGSNDARGFTLHFAGGKSFSRNFDIVGELR